MKFTNPWQLQAEGMARMPPDGKCLPASDPDASADPPPRLTRQSGGNPLE